MNVAHLIDSGGYYGAEAMLITLCLEQIASGFNVQVISISTPGARLKPLEEKLIECGIPYIRWEMLPIPDFRESFKILEYCKKNSIDIIHSHGYKGNILMGLIPLRCRSVPVITTMHGYTKHQTLSKMTIYQLLDKICIRRLNAVVLVSKSMESQVPVKKIGNKLHIIENGVRSQETESNAPAYESCFSQENYKIGSLGRLSHEKNFSMLIDAFSRVIIDIPQARLVIYGEGPERTNLEEQITKLNLKGRVFLPGYQKNVSAFFKDIDVFVNCSLTEGMPISILESMKHGCPVIATDIPANKTLLTPLNIPEQFCKINSGSLASALISFYKKDPEKRAQLVKRYTELFNQKYTSEIMCKKYSSIYSLVQKS
ncbi:MAG: hypothetical protein B0W54_13435 [Cellvibrio sp. 79]|nr:MAG: hypothetical protein B0W54_13435 [Cellvibrio sp. 79]